MDYNEIICQAIDEIVTNKLAGIKFDATILCEIVNDSAADSYQYRVSDGTTIFTAYSQNGSYKNGDKVYVTVPQGDYQNEKIIIGKQVTEDTTPFIYTSKLSSMVDVTNNLIAVGSVSGGLLANDNYDEIQIARNTGDSAEEAALLSSTVRRLWELDGQYLQGYTRLGLQAAFSSNLKDLNCVRGDYGLILTIVTDEDMVAVKEEEYAKAESVAERKKTVQYKLSVKDMYGDPYNFQGYYQQEQVFDISDLRAITKIYLDFYEDTGSFYTSNNNLVYYKDDWGNKIPNNIFVKDPYICLGYSMSEFNNDKIILYCPQKSTYIASRFVEPQDNYKDIYLRWVHRFETPDRIRQVEDGEDIGTPYQIRWYRYEAGAPTSDEYAGTYWKRVNDTIIRETAEATQLTTLNKITTYYLLYHREDNGEGSVANEYSYLENFIPEYKPQYPMSSHIGVPLQQYESFMGYWTDECLVKYGIAPTLATHAFAGYSTSSIIKYRDQSWEDIYKQGFVYHENNYTITDYYTSDSVRGVGCMHRIGFWEKMTLALRLYWIYPYLFDTMGVGDVFKGGVYSSDWDTIKSYRLYRSIGDSGDETDSYYGQAYQEYMNRPLLTYRNNEIILDETGTAFTYSLNNEAMRKVFNAFAQSFGSWTYKLDEYGMRDYVLENDEAQAELSQAIEAFFYCLDSPYRIVREEVERDKQPFYYQLKPDVSVSEEKVKVIILSNYELDENGKPTKPQQVLYSDIITFTNDKQVVNKATVDSMQALTINCEDGSYGNYYEYKIGGQIFDNTKAQLPRKLKVYFDSLVDPIKDEEGNIITELTDAESITWSIPNVNTMIVVNSSDYSDVPHKADNLDDTTENYPNGCWYTANGRLYITRRDIANMVLDAANANTKVYQKYYIKSMYSSGDNSNTVECSIVKDSTTYYATKTLNFGQKGTSGTDATLIIDFDDEKTALTLGDTESLVVTAKLLDGDYHYVTDLNSDKYTITWSWYSSSPSGNLLTRTVPTGQKDKCEIRLTNPNLTTLSSNYYILQCSIRGWGDYELIAYEPIPIRSNKVYAYLSGPTKVMYDSSGNPDYQRTPYMLQNAEKENAGLDIVYKIDYIENRVTNDLGNLTNREGNSLYIPTIDSKNLLVPINFYIKDNTKQICMNCVIEDRNSHTDTILWSNPLYIGQNLYPISMVNEWDGNLKIDEENNAILAGSVVAGKKNSNNTFSGIVMGNIECDAEKILKEQTGLYGFQEGAISYALKEDGSAFFGKSGTGRIYIDGEESTLQSELWKTAQQGMKLDLDDGYIDMAYLKGNETWVAENPLKEDYEGADATKNRSNYYIWRKFQLLATAPSANTTLYKCIDYSTPNLEDGNHYVKNKYFKKNNDGTYTLATSNYEAGVTYYFPERFAQAGAVTFVANTYFKKVVNEADQYIKCDTANLPYDYNEIYYKKASVADFHYSTYGANQNKYPLSIGADRLIQRRHFRVDWQGKVYNYDQDLYGLLTIQKDPLNSNSQAKIQIKDRGDLQIDYGGTIHLNGDEYVTSTIYVGCTDKNASDACYIDGPTKTIYGAHIRGGDISIGDDFFYADDSEVQMGDWHVRLHAKSSSDGNGYGGRSAFYCGPWITSKTGIANGAATNKDGSAWYIWANWKDGKTSSSGFCLTNEECTIGTAAKQFLVYVPTAYGGATTFNSDVILASTTAKLTCSIPAGNQTGIYARFA